MSDVTVCVCGCIMSVCVQARCTIDWKKGKNLTVKTVKKKAKHKGIVITVEPWAQYC